jgi:hypothetical protein
MGKRALLVMIILFMLAPASWAQLGGKPIPASSRGVTAVVTQSWINDGLICREHNPATGAVESVAFYDENVSKCVPGVEVDAWICDGKITTVIDPTDENDQLDCRKIYSSSEFFGQTNPSYSCGGWGCSFWP